MKKIFSLPLFVFLLNIVFAQTTVNIPAAADNTIYATPSGNSNATGQNIFSGTNGGSSPRRGLIKFDVAGVIPAGATITSVTLTLNCNVSRSISDYVFLHKLNTGWGEGTSNAGSTSDGSGATATPNDATWIANFFTVSNWVTPGADFNPSPSASAAVLNTGFVNWNAPGMITDVQNWLINPATNYGWILLCNETTPSTARKFGSRENTNIANRPVLTVTYNVGTVPVTLLSFRAKPVNKSILLEWKTTNEINNKSFKVLHSTNGIHFNSIGNVNSNAVTNMENNYSFIHSISHPGYHYYRLATVDMDESETLSYIIRVSWTGDQPTISLSPNPALNEIQVAAGIDLSNCSYQVFNRLGVLMMKGILKTPVIKTNTLAAGQYFLRINRDNVNMGGNSFIKL